MKLAIVPPPFLFLTLTTHSVLHAQCKMLLPSLLSGMFFKTNPPGTHAPENVSTTIEAAVKSGAPSAADDVSGGQVTGAVDFAPEVDAIRDSAEATQPTDQEVFGEELIITQTEEQAPETEYATESFGSSNGDVTAATPQAGSTLEAPNTDAQGFAKAEEQQLSENDAWNNSEPLQSVGESAEASWISSVSKDSAIEALLPLVAMTPVLAAAGFHADIQKLSSGTFLVRFPRIDYAVQVKDLTRY
ncbi:uncharacterized protein LOC113146487 [Cyclospora cayetanensis]|uniref:Uncharacterized protein LOC113146487 n=1 Tax=Cyclospora cayetanensis TaxID=88456 RepID=A0A6P6RQB6_9EIME|nr:uncharacterized protein LOC113146487 [Cyclospora cayetanensis]